MLLAEINGTRDASIASNEDYLTSAVFGHLRLVSDGDFWRGLFRLAQSVEGARDLMTELEDAGAWIPDVCDLRVSFWPRIGRSEPDLLLHFCPAADTEVPIIILVEVKLFSDKSSLGEDDQLKRYYELLLDRTLLGSYFGSDISAAKVALIYLTERYAAEDVRVSINKVHTTQRVLMYPLQWQDIAERIRLERPGKHSLLGEVLRFLEGRNLEHFRGFVHSTQTVKIPADSFYKQYFASESLSGLADIHGGFYAGSGLGNADDEGDSSRAKNAP